MEDNRKYLYAKDSEKLQLTHAEYLALMEKVEEVKHLQQVKNEVVADLQRVLNGGTAVRQEPPVEERAEPSPAVEVMDVPQPESLQSEVSEPEPRNADISVSEPETQDAVVSEPETLETDVPEVEKVSVEFSADESKVSAQSTAANVRADISEVPPIKNEITEHFNRHDESGRLFNVFKQYYTCLNEACGGTVRVTMKDGFCSLWNYDEWEEFAFVDIFEGILRIAIDPRYTDALKSLSLCEAPRLIASRRNVISVQVDDLSNTVLEVLVRAFSEVGMQVS